MIKLKEIENQEEEKYDLYDVVAYIHNHNHEGLIPPLGFIYLSEYIQKEKINTIADEKNCIMIMEQFIACWGVFLANSFRPKTLNGKKLKSSSTTYFPPKVALFKSIRDFLKEKKYEGRSSKSRENI